MVIKINKDPSQSGYNPLPPDPSTLLNTTGNDGNGGLFGNFSIDSILGLNKTQSFYEDFYNNLLTTANAPSINSLWLVFIQDLPASYILYPHKIRDHSDMSEQWYEAAASEGRRLRGVLLAQGVKHTGDGTNFSRDGFNNTGMLKGVLSNGRTDINTLEISFLESNVSFVDYALRPWAIAVAHAGLTVPDVLANNITVWHLGKMGARTNFARRKVIKYHNCFPISIDQQEYNYSGDDINIKRGVSFGYHYYTMEDADPNVLGLLAYSSEEETIAGAITSFFQQQVDSAIDTLQSQLGANNVTQYLNNLVERATTFGQSVVSNTVQGAVTNFAGGVQGAIDGAIRDFTSEGLSLGNQIVNSVSETTNSAIDSIIRTNNLQDSTIGGVTINSGQSNSDDTTVALSEQASAGRLARYGYVEKGISQSDFAEALDETIEQEISLVETPLEVNVEIDQNDSVIEELSTYVEKEVAENPNDDSSISFNGLNDDLIGYEERDVNEDDVPKFLNPSEDDNPNETVSNRLEDSISSEISYSEINFVETQNIERQSIDLVNFEYKEVSENPNEDSNPSDTVTFEPIAVRRNDANPSETVTFEPKNISPDDSNPSETVQFKSMKVSENDSNPSDTIEFENKTTPQTDSNPSESVNFKSVQVSDVDSNPSDSISVKLKQTKENDSNPSDSIQYREVSIRGGDSEISRNFNVRNEDSSN